MDPAESDHFRDLSPLPKPRLYQAPPLESLAASPEGMPQIGGRPCQEDFYRTILESLAEGVMITDHEGRIIYVNSRLLEITGFSRKELLGAISYRLLTPEVHWPVMERRIRERMAGQTEYYEHQHLRPDGSLQWVAVKATPFRDVSGAIIGTVGAISCIQQRKQLEETNEYLQDELKAQFNFGNILGSSAALRKVLDQVALVAPTETSALILGESGVGKELVARAIHDLSDRKEKPMVRVNCASIPRELFESEFFGHVRGAFTGAVRDRAGRFELAQGGTLFLDEVGEIPLELQGKLLRVLQEGQFERVGEEKTRSVHVRVIAATNRDLLAESKAGRFRPDLYYRLSVFPIEMPPLRDRREDIAPLADLFIKQAARKAGVKTPKLTKAALEQLMHYDWPGNVRELQNVIERGVILARGGALRFDLQSAVKGTAAVPALAAGKVEATLGDLKMTERRIIEQALDRTNGKIYGPGGAAELLALRPTTLASKMKKFGLGRGRR